MPIQFSILQEDSNHIDFDCGEDSLNVFLQNNAFINQLRRLGPTQVITEKTDPSRKVLGYYTICSCHIDKSCLPKKYRENLPNPVPAIRLARLAVDKQAQSKGYGSILLAHALKKCYYLSTDVGGYVILIDVLNDNAKKFYNKFGIFQTIRDEPGGPLILGIKTKDIAKYFLKE